MSFHVFLVEKREFPTKSTGFLDLHVRSNWGRKEEGGDSDGDSECPSSCLGEHPKGI